MKIKEFWSELVAFLKLISVGNKKVLPAMVLGGFAKSIVSFIGFFFSAQILNAAIRKDFEECIVSAVALLAFQFLAGLIDKGCAQIVRSLAESCKNSVKERIAKKAFVLEYEKFEKQDTFDDIRKADVSSMGNGDVFTQVFVCYRLAGHMWAIIFSVCYIVVLFSKVDMENVNFFTSHISTILLIAVYGIAIWANGMLSGKVQRIVERMLQQNDKNNTIGNYLLETFMDDRHADDIRIYQLADMVMERWKVLAVDNMDIYLENAKERGKYAGVISFINQIVTGIAYFLMGAKALYGVISVGDVLLYAGALNQGAQNINSAIRLMQDFMYRASYLKEYEKVINQPDMSYDGTLPIEKRDDAKYEFEFHDVSFVYPGTSEKVLDHVNLKFTVGEKLALVGRNGAGKTTLVKLLCRLYEPTEGFITLNGIDIWKYNYAEYTQAFSVVFQDYELFAMPLDENVAAGEAIDENRLWTVLAQVGLKERVEAMEKGVHTQLYNNNGPGVDISGGEAQRLAIARALYKDGPFVILDEPTAALDPIAEAEIYENFNEMIANKTALYISHRMSSCKFCDRIVVLDYGKIAEFGTHEQLLVKGGIYAELYETQAQYYA